MRTFMWTSNMQTLQFHGQTGFFRRFGCLLAAVLLFLPSPGFPGDFDDTEADYRKSDIELNRAYQSIIKRLDPAGASSLKNVQRAWVNFKEHDFALLARIAAAAGDNGEKFHYMVRAADAQGDNLLSLGTNQLDLSDGGPGSSAEADQMLNSTYKYCIESLPPELVPRMQEIEVLWITFRDLQRRLSTSFRNGPADGEVLRQLTMKRVIQLRQYVTLLLEKDLAVREGRNDDSSEDPDEVASRRRSGAPDVFRFAK
jgi:uncharacterized protein YecT (DUF1311 family)